ncbi:MAG: nuclear transport factor 2 family protein [Pseudomonadota bacterium]
MTTQPDTCADATPESVWHTIVAAYARADIEGVIRHLAPDAILRSSIDGVAFPEAGTSVGHDQTRLRFQTMFANFEMLRFEIVSMRSDHVLTESSVAISIKHRQTGEVLNTQLWFICEFRDGLCHRVDEFIELDGVNTYLRTIGRDPVEPSGQPDRDYDYD